MKKIFLFLLISIFVCMPLWAHHFKDGQEKPITNFKTLGGNFTLDSSLGKKVSLKDYQGKVVIINFGFVSCTDTCPYTLGILKHAVAKLGKNQDQVQVLWITFDPERDTVERLKNYMENFHPKFVGLTGSGEAIAKVAKQYGTLFIKQEGPTESEYFYAHSDYVYLIDQKGRIRDLFNANTPAEEIADGILHLF